MKIFLSSTYLDLIEHRKAVIQALRTMGEEVGHMEIFGARDEEPTRASLEELDKCEVLVGIYAYRYGTIPTGSKTSVTEKEYLHAMTMKIPVLVFVADENYPWPPKLIDKSPTKVNKFKSKATKEHAPDYFTSPDNLAIKVVASIGRLAKSKQLSVAEFPSPREEGTRDEVKGSTLPYQPHFFGREKELAIIADAISPESRTWGALIDGPGGIGKTALAIRAAHLAAENLFERKIFITAKVRELTPEGEKPLKDFSRDTYFSMLNELALELGERGIPRLAPDERANQLRMAMVGRKTMIVFDNLETLVEDDRRRLFQFLSRLPEGNKAIVTSRRRADVDARVIRLDRLSADEALQLMEELAKNNSRLARENERARRDLYEITNGNPLLIKWVCGQLGREGSALHTIAEAYKFIDSTPKNNAPLEYIFGDLIETFTDSETMVLAALSHFTQPAKLKWLTDITGLAEQAVNIALDDLNDRSILIANYESKDFYLPPMAAQFIRKKKTQVVDETGISLMNCSFALIMQYGGHKKPEDLTILDSEWPLISASLPRVLSSENEYLQNFYDAINHFLDFTGRWDELTLLCTKAEQRAVAINDLYHAGWRAYDLGFYHFIRGEPMELSECIERIEKYWNAAGAREYGFIKVLKGERLTLEGNYENAISEYLEALELFRTINPESKDVTSALNYIAEIERYTNNFSAAKKHYQEALHIAKKKHDERGIGSFTGNLALLALDQGKWKEAEKLAESILVMAENTKQQHLIAHINYCLAKSMISQGRSQEGIPYAQRAVAIFSQLRMEKDLESAINMLREGNLAIQRKNKIKPQITKRKK